MRCSTGNQWSSNSNGEVRPNLGRRLTKMSCAVLYRLQPLNLKFPEISIKNWMDRLGSTGKSSKKVTIVSWTVLSASARLAIRYFHVQYGGKHLPLQFLWIVDPLLTAVLSVLLYYDALFSMCSLWEVKIRRKATGNNWNISPEYPTNHSCGVSSNTNRSHLENYRNEKVYVLVKGARRGWEPSQLKMFLLAYSKCWS